MLLFTLMHEMGHILLKKWEYPFVENEELADEFATVVLMMFNQNQIAEAQVEFFATVPPEQELAKKTDSDDHRCETIEVGQPFTQLPPHRSLHAELPHRALQNYSRCTRHLYDNS